MNELSTRIRQLRQQSNMTQRELAEAINVAHNTISQYEHGLNFPSLEVVLKLARLFDVSTDYLLGNDEWAKVVG